MEKTEQHSDFYAVLGVEKDTVHDDIRRAYYRLVRKHPPNVDPDGFQRIKRAWDTLSDERARKSYDAKSQYGEDIQRLMDQVFAYIEKMDFSTGEKLLKRVLVLDPEADEALDLLGSCQVGLGRHDDAIVTYTELTDRVSDVPLYWIRIGEAYMLKAAYGGPFEVKDLLETARVHFRSANEIDRINNTPYLSIAKSYMMEKDYDRAVDWVEKAIMADEGVDYKDFDALFYLARIHAMSGVPVKVLDVAKRIEELAPEDSEIRLTVAAQFVDAAYELMDSELYTEAGYFVDAARKFDPKNVIYWELRDKVRLIVEANRYRPGMEVDNSIIQPVRSLASLVFSNYAGQVPDVSYIKTAERLKNQMATYSTANTASSIEYLKSQYPWFYDLAPQMWDDIVKSLRQSTPIPSNIFDHRSTLKQTMFDFYQSDYKPGTAPASGSSAKFGWGCMFAIIGAFIGSIIQFPIGTMFGIFIGIWIGDYVTRMQDS